MSALLIALSVFPFTFAALMALWSFALLGRAIKASLRGAESGLRTRARICRDRRHYVPLRHGRLQRASAGAIMTSPAPDTGRTAEEMRAEIRKAIKDRWDLLTGPALDNAAIAGVPGAWRRKDLCDQFAETVAAGPLAQILDELDVCEVKLSGSEARVRILHEHMDWWRTKAKAAEANLIALAKMYGEACTELHRLWAAIDWDDVAFGMYTYRRMRERAEFAEAEAAQLRSRLLEAEKGGEAMQAELQVLRTLLKDVADEADDAEADAFLLTQEEGR